MELEKLITTYLPLALSGLFSFLFWLIQKHLKNVEKIGDKVDSLKESETQLIAAIGANNATIKLQQDMLMQLIKEVAANESANKARFDAVFRFIEAPKRPTDT